MSNRYKGAVISATPPTTTGGETGTASGAWTLEQQMQLQAAGLWPSQPLPPFIEDVFSTYLYTGNGTTNNIVNGINLAGKGGLVWMKSRSAARSNTLCDTVRGRQFYLISNDTVVQQGPSSSIQDLTTFNSNGFSLGANGYVEINNSGDSFVSWTFREQPKFFDVVTYTGDGIIGRTVPHNLGVVPGCIIVKRTIGGTSNWRMYHRSLGATYSLQMNTTAAATTLGGIWDNTEPTSTVFSVGDNTNVNGSGSTYVAYLFAHNAGGFGLTETDNVISCGTFTTDGSGFASVNLGYEAQWFMYKSVDIGNWVIEDVMRGSSMTTYSTLTANTLDAESSGVGIGSFPQATGVRFATGAASTTYIYITIRRGPMAIPTVGTTVYQANTYTGNATANTTVAGNFGFPVDLLSLSSRDATAQNFSLYGQYVIDRLQGQNVSLGTATTTANTTNWNLFNSFSVQNSIGWGLYGSSSGGNYMNNSGGTFVARGFRRAPSFFDEVCYTGDGTFANRTHNLTVAPELAITKRRSGVSQWVVIYPITSTTGNYLTLETTAAANFWGSTGFTTTQFGVAEDTSAQTYVTYLFATCAGVSKVGSYTGNAGNTVTVPCGFTAGVRFVLIKRTDSTGDWYVWDSARGIVAGNDPYLLLNSTAAEVTGTDYVDTYAAGFEVTSTAPAGLNATGGTYLFLAIA